MEAVDLRHRHIISLAMLCRLMGLPMHNALLRLAAEYMPILVFLE